MAEIDNGKNYFFVEGFQADAQAKKRMRRHVMMGKNAGKTVQRGSRQVRTQSRQQQVGNLSNKSRPHCKVAPDGTTKFMLAMRNGQDGLPQLGTTRVLRALGIPYFASAESYATVDLFFAKTAERLYPVHLGLSLEEAKFAWLQILLANQTTFDCILALFRASNEILLGNGDSSAKALYYTGRTLKLVNQRLQSSEALSDSTVAIVLSLITQEQMRQQHAAAQVHMRGLARLIELRGGMQQLKGSSVLITKIYKTDIMFAIQTGCPTLLFLDKTSQILTHVRTRDYALQRKDARLRVSFDRLGHSLRGIWNDTMSASALLYDLAEGKSLDINTYYDVILSLSYRLLKFRTLNEAKVMLDKHSAHHMALVAVLMTVLMQHTPRRILKLQLAIECLETIFLLSISNDDDDEFVLWFAIITNMWIMGERDQEWLVQIIRDRSARLGLSSWEEVQTIMQEFPWIDQIHDEPGRKIWNSVQKH